MESDQSNMESDQAHMESDQAHVTTRIMASHDGSPVMQDRAAMARCGAEGV